jgi:GNAT superfamily N-acetyltransferase
MLRIATRDDIPGLARVHVQSWLETYTGLVPQEILETFTLEFRMAQWARTLDSPVDVFVAEIDGEMVGFTSAGTSRLEGFEAEVFTLYLLERAQGSGLGRALFGRALEALQARGFGSCAVCVLAANRSCGFYRHLGGVQVRATDVEIRGVKYAGLEFGFKLEPV